MGSRPPSVGVGCIIVREDGYILLMRRQGAHGSGTWSTPGGSLDVGETLEGCARRESKEETGLSISNVRFHAVTNDIFSEDKHFVTIWMVGDYDGGDLVPSEESSEMDWFPQDSLPTPLFLSLENLINGQGLPPN